MIPQNLTLAELERWNYIENLPGKELLDLHWGVIASAAFASGDKVGYDRGYKDGSTDGYNNGWDDGWIARSDEMN